ncbi:MAG TPA: SDR family NAD(P)-dependent oxidoreductase [Symbiobacteriaceae bacterium]|jgi:polyketide synthase PksL/polyketide synthase PksN
MHQKERHYFIPISARTESALSKRVWQLADWLNEEGTPRSLGDIAYTLLVGRTHFPVRLALVVQNVEELTAKLREASPTTGQTCSRDQADRLLTELAASRDKTTGAYRDNLTALAGAYQSGLQLGWARLYQNDQFRRVSLPSYPYDRDRYWVKEQGSTEQRPSEGLHPLLDSNGSTLEEQCFYKRLSGDEFYLRDHVVGTDKVLPGVAHLEMARAAGNIASRENRVRKITDVVWTLPVKLAPGDDHVDVKISLYPLGPENDQVDYRVTSIGASGVQTVHSQGKLIYGEAESGSAGPVLDLAQIRSRCLTRLDGPEAVRKFQERGLTLGPSFQTIRHLYCSKNEALARLELPAGIKGMPAGFVLHPSLLDGALEAVIGLIDESETGLSLPYAVGEIEILQPLPEKCYAYATGAASAGQADKRFDVVIVDDEGRLLVRVKGFGLKVLAEADLQGARLAGDMVYARVRWEEAPTATVSAPATGDLVLFDTDLRLSEALRQTRSGVRPVVVKPGDRFRAHSDDLFEINPRHEDDYRKLLQAFQTRGIRPRNVAHLWSRQGCACEGADLAAQLEWGFYSSLSLVRSLVESRLEAVRLLHIHPGHPGPCRLPHAAMGGFTRTVYQENQHWLCRTVEAPTSLSAQAIADLILRELDTFDDQAEIRYVEGRRLIKRIEEFRPEGADSRLPVKDGGVYLITGGTGGIGLSLARHIARSVRATLVLTGRTEPGPEKQAVLDEIRALGSEVAFMRSDVARESEVAGLVAGIKTRFHQINGVFQLAGVTRDALIAKKTVETAREVIAPKVFGTANLDLATQNEDLDFFVMFSSVAAVAGNVGQCDYAFANSFLDEFAQQRELLRSKGERRGRTVSVNWGLWDEGGIRVNEATRSFFLNTFGMRPLDTEQGMEALRLALGSGEPQVVVARGERARLKRTLGIPEAAPAQSAEIAGTNRPVLAGAVSESLAQIVSEILRVKTKDISPTKEMSEYGFNSISLTDFVDKVNVKYGLRLTPAVFFEHSNLKSFADFLLTNHQGALEKVLAVAEPAPESAPTATPALTALTAPSAPQQSGLFHPSQSPTAGPVPAAAEPVAQPAAPASAQARADEPIAIIGMSGVFPLSDDLDEFWSNQVEERSLISEVPADRWDWKACYGESGHEPNKTWAKWGGFMREVDKFDSRFFGVSPREAELMDPQQRIFLQTVWKTIEDAGYRPGALSGTRTGLFAGVATMDYYDLLKENGVPIEAHASTGLSHCILVNRISYWFNFRGPSEPIDTACSSSLIAIHRAVESIRNGDCDLAIAGGINVMVSPMLFIAFSKAGMLSRDGTCKTFDKRANGYVRGEGSGAIFLKPLSKAVQDGDHIYAVIKGSSVNHGGHANTLTTPNPNAQEELLVRVYEKAGFDPSTVGYIEAHGTGTSLGDPVEVNGLRKAFDKLYRQWGLTDVKRVHCGLGSVKTNIGHLEAAAGIAGVIRVILSMQHKLLPGNAQFQELNPYIQLDGSPFYIVERTQPWVPILDEHGRELPRRAGVSSFGFGGANAHVVLEEYVPTVAEQPTACGPQLLVLSARTRERLNEFAANLARFLKRMLAGEARDELRQELAEMLALLLGIHPQDIGPTDDFEEYGLDAGTQAQLAQLLSERYHCEIDGLVFRECTNLEQLAAYLSRQLGGDAHRLSAGDGPSLADVAYTLQIGREAMEERLALVVSSAREAIGKLEAFGRGDEQITQLCTANATKEAAPGARAEEQVIGGALTELAQLWVHGGEVDWNQLHQPPLPHRISLPTYPFEKKRHWFRAGKQEQPAPQIPAPPLSRPEALKPRPQSQPLKSPQTDLDKQALAYAGDEVTLEIIDGSIALVTMRDAKNRNMFSDAMIAGLMSRFATMKQNENIKAIIVTGYDNVFCMGGTQAQLLGIADNRNQFTDIPFLYQGLLEAGVPVIAAIQGHASGGGLLFGLYADIIVMSEESIYSAVFTKYGFTPGMGATWILKEKLGGNLATEMMYTAGSFTGEELKQRCASVLFRQRNQVVTEALAIARTLADKPVHTLRVLKRELSRRVLDHLSEVIEQEARMHGETFSHPEVRKRIEYFFARGAQPAEPMAPVAAASAAEVRTPGRIALKAKDALGPTSYSAPEVQDSGDPVDQILRKLEAGEITPEQALQLRQELWGKAAL